MASKTVSVHREPMVFPTFAAVPPDKNPMFLEKRVYQGSSGKVYPLPFYNRIEEKSVEREWDSIRIENEFISVVILPELGGRIHIGKDKTNGYDFFYKQNVIKPALVGLAGPWVSGGVEFNWPQHHRPSTFMPVDVFVEEHPDGGKTVWLSEHDPMERMKGMHGVCLYPNKSYIELKMRAYNRTPDVKTFLWWANVATRVNESYQSFFPSDVAFVADHAKRAMSRFPLCDGHYYGVNYGKRAKSGIPPNEVPSSFVPAHCLEEKSGTPAKPLYAPNDLSWYANIPVPTSYMCLGSKEDFSGGYDHSRAAGLVQVSNHHISPGKKQWTWGNQEFGYAWDRNLTETDSPYIELMLGVYTDNQPDFSFIQPGETKTWSVYWYPIQKIGPAQKANQEAAVSVNIEEGRIHVGVAVTESHEEIKVSLEKAGRVLKTWRGGAAPDRPVLFDHEAQAGETLDGYGVRVVDKKGAELIFCQLKKFETPKQLPASATEPPPPDKVSSADELFSIGTHLSQYRHATRSPVAYWREALRRDSGDARCNNAIGLWHHKRGEFLLAESYYRKAIARVTSRNPNPYDGEAFYNLGITLRFLGKTDEAYDSLYKATWNQAWNSAAYHALGEIDCVRKHWKNAIEHLEKSLRYNVENLRARNLLALVLRELGNHSASEQVIAATLALDPLDWWARHLRDGNVGCDTQTRIDLALDYANAGFIAAAISVLSEASAAPDLGTEPLLGYHLSRLHELEGNPKEAVRAAKKAGEASPDYCFPSRLEDLVVLQEALKRVPNDARAHYYLGNFLYDRKRYDEAIQSWEASTRLRKDYSVVWRNLGIAYFNVQSQTEKAMRAYAQAFLAAPNDSRLVYERDQLWKRVGISPKVRLLTLEKHLSLVAERDDATIELCALYNQTGQYAEALKLIQKRKFQPWEGGEGQALGQYTRCHLALGRLALVGNHAEKALEHFHAALMPTPNLGEARHLLANQSDVYYWLGRGYQSAGMTRDATKYWKLAAEYRGDFQEMRIRSYSEMTYFSALSLQYLGKDKEATALFEQLLAYSKKLATTPVKIDYFATSLPTMLLFEDDLDFRQKTNALFMQAQAELGLGKIGKSKILLKKVLIRDPSHPAASDLLED